jgi:hypothetical protein
VERGAAANGAVKTEQLQATATSGAGRGAATSEAMEAEQAADEGNGNGNCNVQNSASSRSCTYTRSKLADYLFSSPEAYLIFWMQASNSNIVLRQKKNCNEYPANRTWRRH